MSESRVESIRDGRAEAMDGGSGRGYMVGAARGALDRVPGQRAARQRVEGQGKGRAGQVESGDGRVEGGDKREIMRYGRRWQMRSWERAAGERELGPARVHMLLFCECLFVCFGCFWPCAGGFAGVRGRFAVVRRSLRPGPLLRRCRWVAAGPLPAIRHPPANPACNGRGTGCSGGGGGC